MYVCMYETHRIVVVVRSSRNLSHSLVCLFVCLFVSKEFVEMEMACMNAWL